MKKICSLIFIIGLFFCSPLLEAQTMFSRRFQPVHVAGIKAGVNIADQYSPGSEGVFDVKSIIGINAGAYYCYSLNRIFAVQTELSVSVRGSRWMELHYSQEEAKDILTYIDLPVLLRYQPDPFISIHAGPQISYLTRAMQYDYKTQIKGSIEDYYKPLDFGIVAGIQLALPQNIDLTFRYSRGLMSVYSPGGYNYESYNNCFQFTAGYRFEKERILQSRSKTSIKRR